MRMNIKCWMITLAVTLSVGVRAYPPPVDGKKQLRQHQRNITMSSPLPSDQRFCAPDNYSYIDDSIYKPCQKCSDCGPKGIVIHACQPYLDTSCAFFSGNLTEDQVLSILNNEVEDLIMMRSKNNLLVILLLSQEQRISGVEPRFRINDGILDEPQRRTSMKEKPCHSKTAYWNSTLQQCVKCTRCDEFTVMPCQTFLDSICLTTSDIDTQLANIENLKDTKLTELLVWLAGAYISASDDPYKQETFIRQDNLGICNSTTSYWNEVLQECTNCSDCFGKMTILQCQPRQDAVCYSVGAKPVVIGELLDSKFPALVNAVLIAIESAVEKAVAEVKDWYEVHDFKWPCEKNNFWSLFRLDCVECSVCEGSMLHPCKPYRDTVCS